MSVVANLYYFPPITYFSAVIRHKELIIEAQENYQKRSLRNRCELSGSHGIERLYIPLKKGKHQQQNIQDTEIAYDEDWPTVHWRSIMTNYGGAPFFIHYRDQIEQIYSERHTNLFEFNLKILDFIIGSLKLDINVSLTETFNRAYQIHQDIRDNFGHQLGPTTMPPYPQVFSHKTDFVPNLSILDLLMCQGPSSIIYLKNFSSKIKSELI